MIYFYVKSVDNPAFEGKIAVILSTEKGINTPRLLAEPDLISEMQKDVSGVSLVWLPDFKAPILTFDTTTVDPANVTNLTNVMGFYTKQVEKLGEFTPEIDNKFIQVIQSSVGEKIAKFALAMVKEQYKYENTSVSHPINVGLDLLQNEEFSVVTQKQLSAHNNQFTSVFKSISDIENTTLHQNECTDEFFIKIPDRNVLLMSDEDSDYKDLIVKRQLVCTPYTDTNAYLPQYKEKGVPAHIIPLIEGNAQNNSLAIQDNEKKFYTALTEWIEFNIKEEFGTVGQVIDSLSESYLKELADHIYSWHWSHNPHVPVSFNENSELDDDDDNSNTSVSSRYSFIVDNNTDDFGENAILLLNSFLTSASAALGYKVYPEAIVKLARWGTRKPTALVIDGFPLMFELGTNRIKKNIGSISDYSQKLVNGKPYSFVGFIYPSVDIADKTYSNRDYSKVPIGIAVKSLLENAEGAVIDLPMYYSLFDAIDMLKDGSLSVDGIENLQIMSDAKNVKIPIQMIVDDYNDNSDEFLRNPFFRSQELRNLCLDFGTGKGDVEQNLLTIFNEVLKDSSLSEEVKAFRVRSLQEFKEKVQNYEIYSVSAALNVNVATTMFPVMNAVLDSLEAGVPVLTAWDNALSNWSGLRGFFASAQPVQEAQVQPSQKQEAPEQPIQAQAVEQSAPVSQAMDMFAGFNSTENNSSSAEVNNKPIIEASNNSNVNNDAIGNGLIASIPSDAEIYPVLYKKEIVCGAAVSVVHLNGKATRHYTLISHDTFEYTNVGKSYEKSIQLRSFIAAVMNDVYYLACGRNDSLPVKFDSLETIKEFRALIKMAIKDVM